MYKQVRYFAVAGLLAAGVAQAGEEDLVKYRHNLMQVIGGHMGNIAAIIKGEVPYKENLAFHADSLAAAAPLALPAFKTKAMSDKSHALPEIWDDWAKFEKAGKTFEQASADFSKAVAGGDMATIGPALGKLGDSCKGCHDDFTEEEDH